MSTNNRVQRVVHQLSHRISSNHAASDSDEGGPNSLCSRFGLTEPFLKKMLVESHVRDSYAMALNAGAAQVLLADVPSFGIGLTVD